jgi:cysteine desulfurase/selenocysteine lyase
MNIQLEPVALPHSSRTCFDVVHIREQFPIFQERIHGKPLVYLDNAATTQKPRVVLDELKHYYEHDNANVHRGVHLLSERATESYEAARLKVQKFINAPCLREVVFTKSCTEAINLVARSFGSRHLAEGDEVVITWMEHHSTSCRGR